LAVDAASERSAGTLYALLAYGIWGFAPIYWKEVQHFPASELLAWRVLASFGFGLAVIAALRAGPEFAAALRAPRSAASGAAAGLLLAVNWLVFIWAVQNDLILATSLGNYINPLDNELLGLLIQRERLEREQALAVGVATLSVAVNSPAGRAAVGGTRARDELRALRARAEGIGGAARRFRHRDPDSHSAAAACWPTRRRAGCRSAGGQPACCSCDVGTHHALPLLAPRRGGASALDARHVPVLRFPWHSAGGGGVQRAFTWDTR
jgi:hypothetical protein